MADPTAATALRDFPINLDRNETYRSLSLVPSRSVLGKSKTAEPVVDLTIPFYQLFATASDSDLLSSVHLFIFLHLCNLVNHDREEIFVSTFLSGDESRDDNSKFLMDNVQSMFELLRKVKLTLASRSNAASAVHRIEYFVKDIIDSFDENLFTVEFPKIKHNQISTDSIALLVELRRLISTVLFINLEYFPYHLKSEKLEIDYNEKYLRIVNYFQELEGKE